MNFERGPGAVEEGRVGAVKVPRAAFSAVKGERLDLAREQFCSPLYDTGKDSSSSSSSLGSGSFRMRLGPFFPGFPLRPAAGGPAPRRWLGKAAIRSLISPVAPVPASRTGALANCRSVRLVPSRTR